MTLARFDVQQLKSNYDPGADVARQDRHIKRSPFGNLVMAAFSQNALDQQHDSQTMRPHDIAENGDAPAPAADKGPDAESVPVSDYVDHVDGSVESALLGETLFLRSPMANGNALTGGDGKASLLMPNPNPGKAPAETGDAPTRIPLLGANLGANGEDTSNGSENTPHSSPGSVTENARTNADSTPKSDTVAQLRQTGTNCDALKDARPSPTAERTPPPHDLSANGSAAPADDESAKSATGDEGLVVLRHTASTPPGGVGKSSPTRGEPPDTAEDADDAADQRSDSRQQDVPDEAERRNSGGVDVPAPPASTPHQPSGIRLAPTTVDMTNQQEPNLDFSLGGPREGTLAQNVPVPADGVRSMQLSELVARFDEHFLPMVRSGENTFSLRLEPAHLGFLTINCRESENRLTIELVAESAVTREFLVTRSDDLRDIAERCGFETARVDVHAEADTLAQQERERRYVPPEDSGHGGGRGRIAQQHAGHSTNDITHSTTLEDGVLAVA